MGIFNHIQVRKPRKNKFDLSHEKKLSMKMGNIYPILTQEIVPGDSFKVKSEVLIRLAPMIAPVMHRVDVYTHYFFVPNRIVWDEWEDFITGGEDGTLAPIFPYLTINNATKGNFTKGQLSDYLGVPVTDDITPTVDTRISTLPFRGYQTIYNEYFRDQNLTQAVPVDKTSGPDQQQGSMIAIRKRAWEKDYFTSALPWSQRGGEAQIPLGNVTPVYENISTVKNVDGTAATNTALESRLGQVQATDNTPLRIENLKEMSVDATTINDLRKANRLQQWLEKSARGGSRYIEQIMSHFGVRSSDARLQRPEYLGGGKQPIVISEVLNTTGTTNAPQGSMAGHGISVGNSNTFKKTFEEHGYVIGVMSVLPKTTYQQGLERHFTKFDKFDFYWPEFANLGEQEIRNDEIFTSFTDANNAESVWGYQQRYAEYKYAKSSVHGDFRKNLSYWHMGRIFESIPALNTAFVESDPTKRIFAVEAPTVDELYVQIFNNVQALRPMPYFSIPSL